MRKVITHFGITHALLASFALVALADFIFYGHPVGWTLALFEWSVLAAFVLGNPRLTESRPECIFTILLAILGISFILEPGPLAITMASLGMLSLPALAQLGWQARIVSWLTLWRTTVLEGWLSIPADMAVLNKWSKHRPLGVARVARGSFGWIVPLLLSFVFVIAFAIANPVIEGWFRGFFIWLESLLSGFSGKISLWRPMFWVAIFSGAWILFRFRVQQKPPRPPGPPIPPLRPPVEKVIDVANFTRRCLTIFNLVFLVQTALDVRYLWGGAQLPVGMTYAQYAHRGAYVLIFTALLAALFVLVTFSAKSAVQELKSARWLVYLWLGQNVFLVISSFWRLHLYVEVYTLTMMRVAAGIWMLLVALGLSLIAVRIITRRPNEWLLNANALAAVAVLYVSCFVDFKGNIARYNVDHCKELGGEGQQIDATYLASLGTAALPSLRRLRTDPNCANCPLAYIQSAEDKMLSKLADQTKDWRGWTWRRDKLLRESGS